MKKNVLISSNYNPLYFQFVPLVCSVWKKWEFYPILTLITDRPYEDWKWMEEYAEVRQQPERPELNDGIWSKVARVITYDTPADEMQMVSDIDMIPLNKEYYEKQFTFPEDKLVLASADYHQRLSENMGGGKHHKFPGCYMTAKGSVWHEIINPNDLSTEDLLASWKGVQQYDSMEDISHKESKSFSEESLIRRLTWTWNPEGDKLIKLVRGWEGNRAVNRLDRAHWKLDLNKLKNNEYIDCHSLRPLAPHKSFIRPLIDYLGVDPELMDIGIKHSKI